MIDGNTAPRAACTELVIIVLRAAVWSVEMVELVASTGGVPVDGVLSGFVVILVQRIQRSKREVF